MKQRSRIIALFDVQRGLADDDDDDTRASPCPIHIFVAAYQKALRRDYLSAHLAFTKNADAFVARTRHYQLQNTRSGARHRRAISLLLRFSYFGIITAARAMTALRHAAHGCLPFDTFGAAPASGLIMT